MFCGLDFGTSNSSIGTIHNNEPILIPIDGGDNFLPSVIYAKKIYVQAKAVDDREVIKISNSLYKSRDNQGSKKKQTMEEIETQVRNSLQRDARLKAEAEYVSQGIKNLSSSTEFIFGNEAIKQQAMYPNEGIFTKSPKTFLGSKIELDYLNGMELIVKNILAYIKNTAQISMGLNFDNLVLGRPVNYGVIANELSNTQAINIMIRAAGKAGFKNIEFEYEPVAAAIDFERTLSCASNVLVVDIGGGTTDVTMMRLSPKFYNITDRTQHILASSGIRFGGNDFDIAFAFYKIMHHLGKESLDKNRNIINNNSPLSSNFYYDAVQINDIRSMSRFKSSGNLILFAYKKASGEIKNKIGRFRVLHKRDYVYRLNHSSEMAKIHLSMKESINLPLKYLEDDLVIQLDRNDLIDAISNKTKHIRDLINDVISSSGTKPDYIYITGGSSKSPILMNLLFDKEEKIKIISGDDFGSVTKGLILSAKNRFR